MKGLSLHYADIAQDHRWHWAYLCGKRLSFLGPKIWPKIGPSIKNVRKSSSFMHAMKKNILLHLQNYTNYYHLMIDIII